MSASQQVVALTGSYQSFGCSLLLLHLTMYVQCTLLLASESTISFYHHLIHSMRKLKLLYVSYIYMYISVSYDRCVVPCAIIKSASVNGRSCIMVLQAIDLIMDLNTLNTFKVLDRMELERQMCLKKPVETL